MDNGEESVSFELPRHDFDDGTFTVPTHDLVVSGNGITFAALQLMRGIANEPFVVTEMSASDFDPAFPNLPRKIDFLSYDREDESNQKVELRSTIRVTDLQPWSPPNDPGDHWKSVTADLRELPPGPLVGARAPVEAPSTVQPSHQTLRVELAIGGVFIVGLAILL